MKTPELKPRRDGRVRSSELVGPPRSEHVWCVWRPYSIAGLYANRAMAQRVRVMLEKRIAAKYTVSKMKVRRPNVADQRRESDERSLHPRGSTTLEDKQCSQS